MTLPPSPFRPYLLMVVFSLACLSGMGFLLWYEDMQYARPTPLVRLPVGSALRPETVGKTPGGKPLPHFFNPSCPCSRFNRGHLPALYAQFGPKADLVVLQAADTLEATRKYRDGELPMPYVTDPAGALAERCGLSATPQAVLLSPDARLRIDN